MKPRLLLPACLAACLVASSALGCGRGADEPSKTPAPGPSPTSSSSPTPSAGATPAPAFDPRSEPFEVVVSHILFSYQGAARSKTGRTKEQALALAKSAIADLKNGRPFSEVIVFTDDAAPDGRPNATADGPGTYRVSRGASMSQRFIAGAFATPVGEVSAEPVETEFGYHVMKRVK